MNSEPTIPISIAVKYFASIREALNLDAQTFTGSACTVAQLKAALSALSSAHAAALAHPRLCVAVNQQMVKQDAPIKEGDEVAFFPPVTGG
jgi:sulfur-carrier protein